jgi:hypothetical protein
MLNLMLTSEFTKSGVLLVMTLCSVSTSLAQGLFMRILQMEGRLVLSLYVETFIDGLTIPQSSDEAKPKRRFRLSQNFLAYLLILLYLTL